MTDIAEPDGACSKTEPPAAAIPDQLTIVSVREPGPSGPQALRRGGYGVGPGLEAALQADRPTSGAKLVLDLSGVTFMDSTGLHFLVRTAKDADSEGFRLVLRRVPQQVSKLLELSLMRDVFTITD
jgi:ABC-type transporter Mla MlaB component